MLLPKHWFYTSTIILSGFASLVFQEPFYDIIFVITEGLTGPVMGVQWNVRHYQGSRAAQEGRCETGPREQMWAPRKHTHRAAFVSQDFSAPLGSNINTNCPQLTETERKLTDGKKLNMFQFMSSLWFDMNQGGCLISRWDELLKV